MNQLVRLATTEDVTAISEIHAQTMRAELAATLSNPSPTFLETIQPDAFTEGWRSAVTDEDARNHVLVATDMGKIVGFAAAAPAESLPDEAIPPASPIKEEPADAQIYSLEVSPNYRKQGHGSRLLMAVTDIFGQTGAKRVQLWLTSTDTARIRFYQDSGFAPAGVRRTLEVGAETITQHLWFTNL